MRKVLVLFVVVSLYSCGEHYSLKKQFKKEFSKNMHDPSSYELVSFDFIEGGEYSKENRARLDSAFTNNKEDYSVVFDSIWNLEIKMDNHFIYDKALIEIRGKNTLGALIKQSHYAYFFNNKIISIDGKIIY